MEKRIAFVILIALSLVACTPIVPATGVSTPIEITAEVSTSVAETPGPRSTEGPSPTPIPLTSIPTLPSSALSPTELKYKVLDQFPDFFFCDPDFYPIARGDEITLAQQRFPELQADQEQFQAILNHNNLSGSTSFTDEQKLFIYRDYKKLNAIHFEVVGDQYRFQVQTGSEGLQGSLITGTIDAGGSIEIQEQESRLITCPICLAVGTLIDTPRGAVSVENLRVGDLVWTMNAAGERVPGAVLRAGSVQALSHHRVVHILLSDGRELWASPGHPTTDGRMLSEIRVNDVLDDARVTLVEETRYDGTTTYDILVAGDTSFYWANGILMGSTMAQP